MKEHASPDGRANRRELTFSDLFLLLSAHRLTIAAGTTLVTAVATVAVLLLPNQYTATATILPPQRNSSVSAMLGAQLQNMSTLSSIAGKDLGLKDSNDLYLGMLQSRAIEDAIVHQFHLDSVYGTHKPSDTRKALEKHVSALTTKAGFINISVEDKDPNRAAQIANAYVAQLQQLTAHLAVTEAAQRRLFFDQQLQSAQGQLVTAEQRLKETQQKTGVLQLDAQMRAAIESVAQLRAEIAAKEIQLRVLSSYAGEENPTRIRAVHELQGLQSQLALLESQPRSGEGDTQVPTSQIPAIGMTYLTELRDIRYYETVSELLAKQYEVAKLDEARQGEVLQILDPAVAPDTTSSPHRVFIVLLVFLLGILGSAAFVILRSSLNL